MPQGKAYIIHDYVTTPVKAGTTNIKPSVADILFSCVPKYCASLTDLNNQIKHAEEMRKEAQDKLEILDDSLASYDLYVKELVADAERADRNHIQMQALAKEYTDTRNRLRDLPLEGIHKSVQNLVNNLVSDFNRSLEMDTSDLSFTNSAPHHHFPIYTEWLRRAKESAKSNIDGANEYIRDLERRANDVKAFIADIEKLAGKTYVEDPKKYR